MARLTLNFVNKNEGDLVKATVEGGFYNTLSTRTTTNNALTLKVLDGDYTLTVEGDGYEDYIQSVSVVGDTTIEVALVPLGAGKYPYVPADNLYLGNQEVQKLYLGSRLLWEREDGNVTRISRGQYKVNPVMKAGQSYDIVINGAIDYIRVTYTDETEEMFSGFSNGIPYSITPENDIKLIKVYRNYSFFDPESIVINAK